MMAVEVRTWHSKASSSVDASPALKTEKLAQSGTFRKKLATAEKKFTAIAKGTVAQPPKAAASKIPVGKPVGAKEDGETAEEAGVEGSPDAAVEKEPETSAAPSTPAPVTRTSPSIQPKQAPHTATEADAHPEKAVASNDHPKLIRIDPDGRNAQARQEQIAKPKPATIVARGVQTSTPAPQATAIVELHSNDAANLISPTKAESTEAVASDAGPTASQVAAPSQMSGEEMATQPTFGTASDFTSSTASSGNSGDAKPADQSASGPAAALDDAATVVVATVADLVDHTAATPARAATADALTPEAVGVGNPNAPLAAESVKPSPNLATSGQARFVEENHPKIVTGISGQLMPRGGTMQLRLDPPGLGAMQVTVRVRDGTMTAAFETSSDEATRQLSHSLGQLKASLEAVGMNVEKLHVEQAPKKEGDSSQRDSDSHTAPHEQQQQARQEKQRREMMQRMWAKLAGTDALDLVG